MTAELEIFLFGPPQLRYRGTPFAFHARSDALTLLIFLLLHRAHAISREAIAFALWPDLRPHEARTRLRANLHALLRSGLPPASTVPWIVATRRALQWNPQAPAKIDIAEFDELLVQPNGVPAAIQLCRGELAEGLDEEWLRAFKDRFRDKQSAALVQLVEDNRKTNNPRQGIQYAQKLLELDPYREDAIRTLIELRYESGDRAGALHAYHAFVHRLKSELDADPMAETIAVYKRVAAAGDGPAQSGGARHNLPAQLTSFVDREGEVESLIRVLKERRLVTLTGPGGIGKTRLALESAHTLLTHFPDGVWMVELGGVRDPRIVLETTAAVLGIKDPSQWSSFITLQPKSLLLILDNCEHLLTAVAAVANSVLAQCPRVHILATSREALHISGERLFRVEPLPVPSPEPLAFSVERLRASPSVRLFFERAGDISPAFALPKSFDEWLALITLLRQVNGIPLAIELAAARTNTLTIKDIAQGVQERFDVLSSGGRRDVPRHQTMRACLDWSYDLLDADEQRQIRRISVFSDGCSPEAAAFVCADQPEGQTLALLQSLVEKSLLFADVSGRQTRYWLIDSIRTYAREKFRASSEHLEIERRHASFYTAFAENLDESYTRSVRHGKRSFLDFTGVVNFVTPLVQELENLRAAAQWLSAERNDVRLGARLVGSLWRFFVAQSLYTEGEQWAQEALDALGPGSDPKYEGPLLLVRALTASAPYYMPAYRRSDVEDAQEVAERAVSFLEKDEVVEGVPLSMALGILVMNLQIDGDIAQASRIAQIALEKAREANDPLRTGMALYFQAFSLPPSHTADRVTILDSAHEAYLAIGFTFGVAYTLLALGEAAFENAQVGRALRSATEAQAYFQKFNDNAALALVRSNIAKYFAALGNVDQAREAAFDALLLAQQSADAASMAMTLQPFAAIALAQKDPAAAARLLGAADRLLELAHRRRVLFARMDYERMYSTIASDLRQGELATALHLGRSWDLSQLIAAATAV